MMKDRTAYDLFTKLGDVDDFSPLGRTVARALGEYYEVDSAVQSAEPSFLREQILGRLSTDKHAKPLQEYFSRLPENVSVANVERELRDIHRRAVGQRLSLALANGAAQGDIDGLIADYTRAGDSAAVSSGPSDLLVDVFDTEDLLNGDANVEYIRLWPKALNDRLDGGALRGHHVLVYARPENGKTLVAINLCAGFIQQRLRVLYVANEEPAPTDIRDRIRGRLLRVSKADIRRERTEAAERLPSVQLGSLKLAPGVWEFGTVRRLLEAGSYDVVILDQLRNMRVRGDSMTDNLENAAKEARIIGQEYNVLVVSVTQAGDSATGRVYLEMNDVADSKTGIPGAVDLMVGVGADDAMKLNGLLGISLPKNKLSGVHDKFTVSVNYQTGVIE